MRHITATTTSATTWGRNRIVRNAVSPRTRPRDIAAASSRPIAIGSSA
jgi:hypothetical protein